MRNGTSLSGFTGNSLDKSELYSGTPRLEFVFDNGRYPATMFISFLGTTIIFLIVLPS